MFGMAIIEPVYAEPASFIDIRSIKQLEWIDPYGREPGSFKEWCKGKNNLQFLRIGKVSHFIATEGGRKSTNLVDLIVDSRVYSDLISELNQFSDDLVSEGYSVQIDTVSGMNHQTLRTHLAGLSGLVGAIFIGELPVAWYEMSVWGEEEFPIDLYFMDLDGNWIDGDGDGLYDGHTGDVEPEIWVGRLYARPLLWDNEIRLMKQYFEKNHQYRTTGLGVPQRALSFVDDDWTGFGNCSLNSVYAAVTVITGKTETTASKYRQELNKGYEWIQLCAHSSPWGHTFKVPGGYKGTVFNYEIFVLNPRAVFYNLFSCSGTRFVEENYSAGWYIFGEPYGLSLVGSTKGGAMLYFEDFYKWLGQNENIGDAFKKWFIQWGESSRPWFYGLNIIGDPSLKPLSGGTKVASATLETSKYCSEGWLSPEVVASHSESDGNPNLISADGKLWIIFESGRSTVNGRSDIYCAYKDMSGWSGVMNIGPHELWDFHPVIGMHKSKPIAIWAHYDYGGTYSDYNLHYSKYINDSWVSPEIIFSDPSWDLRPSIASADDTLWLAWQTRRDLNSNIYTACFQDNTWSSPKKVTQSDRDELSPVIVIDKSNAPWVFYCKYTETASQIWSSHLEGVTWIEDGPISGAQVSAYKPTATVDSSGRIWVGWQAFDEGKGNIYVSYYDGSKWVSPMKILTGCENSIFPSMTSDITGTSWIVWQGKVSGEWNIYAAWTRNTLWSSSPEAIGLVGPDINPKIAADSNCVWVTWQNYQSNNWDVYVSKRVFVGIEEFLSHFSAGFQVSQFHPNPFSEVTTISYQLPVATGVSLKIYDITGRLVKTLADRFQKPGCHKARWNGRGEHHRKLTAGIYFCVIETSKNKATRKLYLVH